MSSRKRGGRGGKGGSGRARATKARAVAARLLCACGQYVYAAPVFPDRCPSCGRRTR